MVIWPPHEAFYIQAMRFNAESALASIHDVSDAVNALSALAPAEPLRVVDRQRFLDALQNIVVQGAGLSRYFWPVQKKATYDARGQFLRTVLGVGDESPLKSRELRNAIEHFDERLDDYLTSGIVGHILPQYVGARPSHDGVPLHLLRAYYLNEGVFALLGEEIVMQPLVHEIVRIHHALVYSDTHGGRLQQPAGGRAVTIPEND